jgi:hypothetical protein
MKNGKKAFIPYGPEYSVLRRILYLAIAQTVIFSAVLIAMLVLMAGAYSQSALLTKTGDATVSMHESTQKMQKGVGEWVTKLRGHFPANQDVVVLQQALGTLENVHRSSARLSYLLSHVQPSTVPNIMFHADAVLQRVQAILSSMGPKATTRINALVDRAIELLGAIKQDDLHKLVETVQLLSDEAKSKHLFTHLSTLAETAKGILDEIQKKHEIKLSY